MMQSIWSNTLIGTPTDSNVNYYPLRMTKLGYIIGYQSMSKLISQISIILLGGRSLNHYRIWETFFSRDHQNLGLRSYVSSMRIWKDWRVFMYFFTQQTPRIWQSLIIGTLHQLNIGIVLNKVSGLMWAQPFSSQLISIKSVNSRLKMQSSDFNLRKEFLKIKTLLEVLLIFRFQQKILPLTKFFGVKLQF